MFEQAEDLLTVPEACELLRIGRGAIYPLLASGQLKAFRKIGRASCRERV